MRHRKSGRHLNRTSAHRKAMFSNMAASLIEHEVIQTTTIKAKELRRTIEPLITLAKEDSVANRRLAFARLRNKSAVGKLFTDLGPRYQSRPGGYTRILKAGYRSGDATMVAYIELVGRPRPDYADYDEDVDDEQIASATEVAEDSIEDQTEAADDATEEMVVDEAVADKETLEATDEDSEVDDSTASDESGVEENESTDEHEDPLEAEEHTETQEEFEQESETEDTSEAEEGETDTSGESDATKSEDKPDKS